MQACKASANKELNHSPGSATSSDKAARALLTYAGNREQAFNRKYCRNLRSASTPLCAESQRLRGTEKSESVECIYCGKSHPRYVINFKSGSHGRPHFTVSLNIHPYSSGIHLIHDHSLRQSFALIEDVPSNGLDLQTYPQRCDYNRS
jgi:hypothetical protein